MDQYRIAFSLLANARRFLESAVDMVGRKNADSDRFAVLHLVTALESLVKAKLVLRDPSLIFRRRAVPPDSALRTGQFSTVNFEDALGRLQEAQPGARFGGGARLQALVHMRHRITHFDGTVDSAAARATIATGVNLFLTLHNPDFSDDNVPDAQPLLKIAETLARMTEFAAVRLEHIGPDLRAALRPRTRHADECYVCFQDAAIVKDGNLVCLFCGESRSIEEATELFSKDGSAGICAKCNVPSVLKSEFQSSETTYECFICGDFEGPEMQCAELVEADRTSRPAESQG